MPATNEDARGIPAPQHSPQPRRCQCSLCKSWQKRLPLQGPKCPCILSAHLVCPELGCELGQLLSCLELALCQQGEPLLAVLTAGCRQLGHLAHKTNRAGTQTGKVHKWCASTSTESRIQRGVVRAKRSCQLGHLLHEAKEHTSERQVQQG